MASKNHFTYTNQSRNVNTTNNYNTNARPPTNVPPVHDNDEDFLDISDTELIRASQIYESQPKFTNNVHHTTSNALNIFSQFTNDAPQQSQQHSQMPAPNMTITGRHTKPYNANTAQLNMYSQLEEAKDELKKFKSQNMQKEGEVKLLRDRLKKQEQEMQQVRNEKLELIKKLHQQEVSAKKHLEKQIEFKELENQFKSQELTDLAMKVKQLEARIKKGGAVSLNVSQVTYSSSNTGRQDLSQMNVENIFDEEFSRKKPGVLQPPPLNPNKSHGVKRLAPQQGSNDSLFHSDGENETPVHESKRPNNNDSKEFKDSVLAKNQQPLRSTLSSITNSNSASTPNFAKELTRKEEVPSAIQKTSIKTNQPTG